MPVHRGGTLKIEPPWRIWQGTLTGNLTESMPWRPVVFCSLTPATCWDVLAAGQVGRILAAQRCATAPLTAHRWARFCQFRLHL